MKLIRKDKINLSNFKGCEIIKGKNRKSLLVFLVLSIILLITGVTIVFFHRGIGVLLLLLGLLFLILSIAIKPQNSFVILSDDYIAFPVKIGMMNKNKLDKDLWYIKNPPEAYAFIGFNEIASANMVGKSNLSLSFNVYLSNGEILEFNDAIFYTSNQIVYICNKINSKIEKRGAQ